MSFAIRSDRKTEEISTQQAVAFRGDHWKTICGTCAMAGSYGNRPQ